MVKGQRPARNEAQASVLLLLLRCCASRERLRVHPRHRAVAPHVAVPDQVACGHAQAHGGYWARRPAEGGGRQSEDGGEREDGGESGAPQSQLSGLSASGWESSAVTARHTDCSVHAGVHESGFRMSRHISPVLKSTFGWKIGVTKETLGGASG